MDNHEIVNVNLHWELYINGRFYCSADTYQEAEKEWEAYVWTLYLKEGE